MRTNTCKKRIDELLEIGSVNYYNEGKNGLMYLQISVLVIREEVHYNQFFFKDLTPLRGFYTSVVNLPV